MTGMALHEILNSVFKKSPTDFAGRVAAAETAFSRKPSDLEPFSRLGIELQQHRMQQAQQLIAISSAGTSPMLLFSEISKIIESAKEADNDAPLAAAQKGVEMALKLESCVTDLQQQSAENRGHIISAIKNHAAFTTDFDIFSQALQKLPGQYAGNPKACLDRISTLASNVARTQQDNDKQGMRLNAMLTAADEQSAKVTAMRETLVKGKSQVINAVQMAETAAAAIQDVIDSMSTGTRNTVAVNKPLTLKRNAAPAA